jgi:hypothetical protein
MILAYLLHLHTNSADGRPAKPVFLAFFVVGGILLFGASLLGSFWVAAACVFVLVHQVRKSAWRDLLQGPNPLLLGFFLIVIALLSAYYLSSLLKGAGASRLTSSTPATVLFAAYEVLGLAGIGPSRLELRSLGATALAPYAIGVLPAGGVLVVVLAVGLNEARARVKTRALLLMGALSLFPIVVVIASGFAMHWRVLGRHLIAALPLLNLVLALGLARLLQADGRRGHCLRRLLAVSAMLVLVYSSCSLRFSPQHRKDDYRAAAALAQGALVQRQRVWWAADVIGARYYGLAGEFDVMGELTGLHKPMACSDLPGAQPIANASKECLRTLSPPDVIILSKPETFDINGHVTEYLMDGGFSKTQELPAFTVWKPSGNAAP